MHPASFSRSYSPAMSVRKTDWLGSDSWSAKVPSPWGDTAKMDPRRLSGAG